MKPAEEFLCKRRSIVEKSEEGISYVKTTFSVKMKLDKRPIYSRYPFMIFECSSRIEVMEFEHNNLQCKPNLVFHKSLYETGSIYEYFKVRDPFDEIFDQSVSFDFLTPYPSVKVDGKSGVCQGFRIIFCEQPLLLKLVNFYGPLLLIVFLNGFHVLSAPQSDPADYIANTSAIALALFSYSRLCKFFSLPLGAPIIFFRYPKQSYQVQVGWNECGCARCHADCCSHKDTFDPNWIYRRRVEGYPYHFGYLNILQVYFSFPWEIMLCIAKREMIYGNSTATSMV